MIVMRIATTPSLKASVRDLLTRKVWPRFHRFRRGSGVVVPAPGRDTCAIVPNELSPSAAAARIGATTRSVQRWITTGRLPARRVGGRWRVASDAIDAFMAGG